MPVVIYNCKSSCGCVVPKCPKKPIEPGGSGIFWAKFDTKNRTTNQNPNDDSEYRTSKHPFKAIYYCYTKRKITMKNFYWLLVFVLLFSYRSKDAIILIEHKPEKIEVKPIIQKDTIIDTEPTFAQFEIDSQHIVFRQFEENPESGIYYKSDDKASSIDTIEFSANKYLKLGKIVQNSKVVITIPFINTGKYPLVIRHCKSSGGLLTDCPKKPIFPNDTSYLDLIIYSRNIIGKSTKTATVTTNAEQESFRIMAKWEYVAEE
ncbi:MAG: hypothetical protein ACI94Y_001997 [Maribacter sp.]